MKKTKELQINSKIAPHDLQIKMCWLVRSLEKGCSIKVNIIQRGRMESHAEFAESILQEIRKAIEGKAKLGGVPLLSGPTISLLLAPIIVAEIALKTS